MQLRAIADIHLLKGVTVICCDIGQQLMVTRVSELIEVDHRILGIMDDTADNSRTDKTGSTG